MLPVFDCLSFCFHVTEKAGSCPLLCEQGTKSFVRYPDKVLLSQTIGTIHLCRGEYGIGTFAHELTHFLINMSSILDMIGEMEEHEITERLCELAEEITREWWTWWDENLKELDNEQ